MAINPTALSNTAATLLPPTITGPIFDKAVESSAVMSLARRVPLSISATTAIPVPMDIPIADWVAEGGAKSGGQIGVGVKLMTGKKLALLVPVSDEVVMSNPGGLYDQLRQDLPLALSRAFDHAAITGLSLKTGSAGPFSDYIALTPNTVALGTSNAAAGGIYTDLVKGVGKIVDANYDMTGWAADPRLQVDAMLSLDTNGRPLLSADHSTATRDVAGTQQSLLGWPATFNKGISGRYWRAGNTVTKITITAIPTGGNFTVYSGGNSYVAVYNVAAQALQDAIQAWGGIYATVTVGASGIGGATAVYTITFPQITSNVLAASAPITVKSAITGNSATLAVTTAGEGGVDSTIRAVAGDWSQAAYGVGMDITVKVSTEANYFDGANWHSAFQENLTLLLVEAYYGFCIGNPLAFTVYTKGSALL